MDFNCYFVYPHSTNELTEAILEQRKDECELWKRTTTRMNLRFNVAESLFLVIPATL